MAGLTYDGIPSTQIDSTNFSGANAYHTIGSFTDIRAAGSFIGQRLNEPNGAVFTASLGSPGGFGAIVQAGFAGPLVNTTGSAVFARAFTNRDYIVTVSPITPLNDGLGSTVPYTLSGVSHATSGCTITGVSGTTYQWIAVGI